MNGTNFTTICFQQKQKVFQKKTPTIYITNIYIFQKSKKFSKNINNHAL